MVSIADIGDKIKILKEARNILHKEYEKTEFHKKKEANPDSTIPPNPKDEEVYKLLNAINEIDVYIKKFQDIQFELLKNQDV